MIRIPAGMVSGGLGITLLAAACASTVNLLNPTTPEFEGHRPADSLVPTTPRQLRIVTFNVQFARAIDSAIVVLRSDSLRGADVVALEEMDETGVARIARALGLNYVYYPAAIHPVTHRYFGPAVLSPWPVDSGWKLLLPHTGRLRHQRRTATAALLRMGGLHIRVYAVHLETQSRLTTPEREDQARAILQDAAGCPDPVVIAGDFNSHWIGRLFEAAGFLWPTRDVGRTVAWFSWDHIFVRGLAVTDPPSAGVAREGHHASDHRAVWAVVALPAAEEPSPAPARDSLP
jgi:endonuclease/exonuclease/phosphatase family metal-dependent hydrolase